VITKVKFSLIFFLLASIGAIAFFLFRTSINQKNFTQKPSTGTPVAESLNIFTIHGKPVKNGALVTFAGNNGGVFLAGLKKVYEENQNLFIDVSFSDASGSSTQKIMVSSKNVPHVNFYLSKTNDGEIQKKGDPPPDTLSYDQTFITLQKYVGSNVIFILNSVPILMPDQWKTYPILDKPSTVKLNENDTMDTIVNCNKAFFLSIQNKDFSNLHCIPYIQYATVHEL